MVMIATVERVRPDRLFVRDRRTRQIVVVNTRPTRCFFPGDVVSILFSGVMTRSFPPQIIPIAIRNLTPRRGCR